MPTVTKSKPETTEALYPKFAVSVATVEEGAPLTADQARELLGWQTPEEDGETFEREFTHFRDRHSVTVHCSNTVKFQRPYYTKSVDAIMWDILAGNWQFNGAPVQVGQYGAVLNGKHRLTALVLAAQEYDRNPDRYPAWDSQPTIDVVVQYGLEESQRLVQTLDTGRGRSLADSFYSSGMFEGRTRSEIKQLAKITEHAVRFLWDRTGAVDDAYTPTISHTDAANFIERHPSILECVESLFVENDGSERRIHRFISVGYASGLMYLQSASGMTTDQVETYRAAPCPNEDLLDLSHRDKAEEYWVGLVGGDKAHDATVAALTKMAEEGNVNVFERIALLVKGWNAWLEKGTVSAAAVKLKYETDDYGYRHLVETPVVTGLDCGPAK